MGDPSTHDVTDSKDEDNDCANQEKCSQRKRINQDSR